MQQSKLEHDEEVQDELTSLRGQVATLHDNIACLQQELEESRSSNTSNGKDISDVVDKLHRENIELQNNISRLSSEKSSLEGDITHLHNMVKALEQQQHFNQGFDDTTTQQLEAEVQELKFKLADKEQEAVAAKEKMNQAFNHHASEIEQLQTTLRELELKLADKDNEAKSAKEDMKHALERKDEDILKLTAEGFLRGTTIKDMTRQIEAKSIVDSLQANFCDDRSDPVVEDDEEKDYGEDDSLQDLLADNIESDDYLRDQIVILAQALERSELQRADVLDRLTRERKSNSDSLKQLGESVKRFYSAVRCSDT
jgi:chromosome segregation ATPase